MKRAAFFDRDGVINLDHGYVGSPERFDLVEGAARAIVLCREAGYRVFVVTNQAGVAHGYFDEAAVAAVHAHMHRVLAEEGAAIDDVRYCPHHPDAKRDAYRTECSCRKPGAGMILDLAETWQVDLSRSFLIGDKDSDLAAAEAVHMPGFLYREGPLDLFIQGILSRMQG